MQGILENFVRGELEPIAQRMTAVEQRMAALEQTALDGSKAVTATINARAAALINTLDEYMTETDARVDAIDDKFEVFDSQVVKAVHGVRDIEVSLGKMGSRLDQDGIIIKRVEQRVEEYTATMEAAQRAVSMARSGGPVKRLAEPAPALGPDKPKSVSVSDLVKGGSRPPPAPVTAPSGEDCPTCGAANVVTRKRRKLTVCTECAP
jgi:hypothetical protein